MTDEVIKELKTMKEDLGEVLQSEEIIWKQRAWVKWSQEGDLNSKFFHERSSGRYKKNRICNDFLCSLMSAAKPY